MLVVVLVVAAIVICGIGVLAVLSYAGRSQKLPESYIDLYIPFSRPPTVDAERIAGIFKARWASQVWCRATEASKLSESPAAYLLSNGKHSLTVTIRTQPLPKGLTELFLYPAFGLNDEEISALRNHRASVNIRYAGGDPDHRARVLFAAQALLAFLGDDGALGYANASAQSYRPKRLLPGGALTRRVLQDGDLYLLFVSVQQVDEGGSYWLHTHGLEQFGLPNLEVTCGEGDSLAYCTTVLQSAAAYMLERGNILKDGDSLSLGQDAAVFAIAVKKDEHSPTGVVSLSKR